MVLTLGSPQCFQHFPRPLEHFPPAAPHLLPSNQSVAATSIFAAAMLLAQYWFGFSARVGLVSLLAFNGDLFACIAPLVSLADVEGHSLHRC